MPFCDRQVKVAKMRILVATFLLIVPQMVNAQQSGSVQGRTPTTSLGDVGRRQTRGDLAQGVGVEPMDRIETRIANRVQSRIRNRIDRFYDPQANALSPFEDAGEKARKAIRRSH